MAYGYYRSVTIDHTKVPNTDQANFPVLVSGTFAYLATVANSGKVQNANGYDVAFFSDSALTTQLKHETEKYTASTGAVVYHVKVPSVSHTTDTVIYMAYGDATISTDQSDKTNVWDTNFKAVYHLGDGSTLSLADSTTNANTLTNNNSTPAVTGQVSGGANFNGTNQNLTLSSVLSLGTSSITVSMWADLLTASESGAFVKVGDANSGYGIGVGTTDFDTNGNKLLALFETIRWITVGPTIGTGWHHVALKIDGSGVPSVTLDGGTPTTASGTGAVTPANTLSIGGYTGGGALNRFGNYYLDEIRISNALRSTDWTTAEYNNQSSPSTFYTVGSENTVTPPNSGAQVTDTYTATSTWVCPSGVTILDYVETWGSGGAGGLGSAGLNGAAGGGGGGYSKKLSISVTPGNSYTVTVGVAGATNGAANTPGGDGNPSWFSTTGTVYANGGQGGIAGSGGGGGSAGGATTGSAVGDTKFAGGNGALTNAGAGGGGGGGAGTAANGTNASGTSGGAGGSTGGGSGGNGSPGGTTAATTASTIGGGGAGGSSGSGAGLPGTAGARGEVRITYTLPATTTRRLALLGVG